MTFSYKMLNIQGPLISVTSHFYVLDKILTFGLDAGFNNNSIMFASLIYRVLMVFVEKTNQEICVYLKKTI